MDMSGKKKSLVLFVLPVVFCLSLVVAFIAQFLNSSFAILTALGLLVAFTITVPFMLIWLIVKVVTSRKQVQADREAMKRFAERNSFSYKPAPTVLWGHEDPIVQMELPYKDTEATLFEGFAGKIRGWPFEYGNYIVRLTGGSEGRTLNILRLQLPITMPRLLANSKHNNLLDFGFHPNNFSLQEQHRLEGDFPKYYTVHAEKSDRIPAIAVLSPEVMWALKEHAYFDVWVQGQELMLITSGVNFFPTIPDAFKTVEILIREIDLIARSMNGQARNPATQPDNPGSATL